VQEMNFVFHFQIYLNLLLSHGHFLQCVIEDVGKYFLKVRKIFTS